MYYLIYGFLKALSFLPIGVLYLLGDVVYVLMYYVFGYRKKVVLNNLSIAFPEKTEAERIRIMKDFYHNLCDTFMEIIKLFSWSEKQILKRVKGNMDVINEWAGKSQSIQIVTGHFFNWEFANLGVAAQCKLPFLAVYMPLKNKVMDRILQQLRSRTGTILISAADFKNALNEHLKKQYALILVGDQNPANPRNAYWLHFFSQPAPFAKGPEKGARMKNTAVIYVDYYKVKRGYYEFRAELVTANAKDFEEGALTKLLVSKVETAIRKRPDNYLWSHRRWKHTWIPEYGSLLD
jgi:KDO2-lipid IV(A) lauroyltransferase